MKGKDLILLLLAIVFALVALKIANREEKPVHHYREVVESAAESYTDREIANKEAVLYAAYNAAKEYGLGTPQYRKKLVKDGYLVIYYDVPGNVLEVQFNGQFNEVDWRTAGQIVTITPKF